MQIKTARRCQKLDQAYIAGGQEGREKGEGKEMREGGTEGVKRGTGGRGGWLCEMPARTLAADERERESLMTPGLGASVLAGAGAICPSRERKAFEVQGMGQRMSVFPMCSFSTPSSPPWFSWAYRGALLLNPYRTNN